METLRTWLQRSGSTQADLAKAVGVTEGAVSQWLNGHVRPSLDSLIAVAEQTGISLDALVADLPKRVN